MQREVGGVKYYITFGQSHIHKINGKVFDKDCVAVVEAGNPDNASALIFDLFSDRFCSCGTLVPNNKYYPRGFIKVENGK